MIPIISKFISHIKVGIPKLKFEELVLSHPDYPSMLSIADTLELFGVTCTAFKITTEKFSGLTFPCLLFLDTGEIILVKNVTDLEKNKPNLDKSSGAILQVDNTKSIKPSRLYKREKYSRFRLLLFVVLGSILILIPFLYSFSGIKVALLITSVGGIVAGYVLIANDLGIRYDVVETFCNAGKKNNCNKILNSGGSKLFGLIKLSDAVIIYFIFQAIILWLSSLGTTLSFVPILAVFSVVTPPLILFSLYYQYFKAKTWCLLCLVVIVILVVQGIVIGFGLNENLIQVGSLTFNSVVISLLLFIIVGLIVLLIKNEIKNLRSFRNAAIEANRIKHSISVFTSFLDQQKKIDETAFPLEMQIGNPEAPLKIIVVSSLYCSPCKEQHKKVTQLISDYPNKVNVSFRFVESKPHKDFTAFQYVLQYWLDNIYGTPNESESINKMLHVWYSTMNLEKFMLMYPVNMLRNGLESKGLEKEHLKWAEKCNILHTPTLFINGGYQLPKNYSLEDITKLIPSFIDYLQNKK